MIEKKSLTGYHLKLIALITMLIDHIAAVLIIQIYRESYHITATMQLSENFMDQLIVWVAENQNDVYKIYDLMRDIGRMAFPIYCFLLVEGFLYTKSVAKYAVRLFMFALISEIPFDLAIGGEWWQKDHSNVFFTLVLGLFTIWGISYIEKYYGRWKDKLSNPILSQFLAGMAGIVVVAATGILAENVLNSDYGIGGVVAIAVMYLLRNKREAAYAMGVLVLTIFCGDSEILALFMLLCIMNYDGTRGKSMKYVFYVFYPLHLLVLGLISMMIS
ncbi:MAG: conjugal transfer protein TraX [Agathobacter sp.]|nr:conjugal transfer protein TraX [Agathobacter sp.]